MTAPSLLRRSFSHAAVVLALSLMLALSTSAEEEAPTEEAAASGGGGGIGNFPGMANLNDMISGGGFGTFLGAESCDPEIDSLPEACRAALVGYPAMFAKVSNLDVEGVDFTDICAACDMDDVVAYVAAVRAKMDGEKDPTCDGSMAEQAFGDPFFDLLSIFMKSTCVTNDEGENCWTDVIGVKVLPEAGLDQTMGAIDFDNLSPATLTTLMTNLDVGKTCGAMKAGGCCTSMMMDIAGAMTKLTCINTPMIDTAFSSFPALCGGLDDTCDSYDMPSYTAPDDCPDFTDWLGVLADLKLASESSYAGCVNEAGCPTNECELMMCSPKEA